VLGGAKRWRRQSRPGCLPRRPRPTVLPERHKRFSTSGSRRLTRRESRTCSRVSPWAHYADTIALQPLPALPARVAALMDARVSELHCIMPIDNVSSVIAHGILSYERRCQTQTPVGSHAAGAGQARSKASAGRLKPAPIRESVLPRPQSDAIQARSEADRLCVLRVSTQVLNLEEP